MLCGSPFLSSFTRVYRPSKHLFNKIPFLLSFRNSFPRICLLVVYYHKELIIKPVRNLQPNHMHIEKSANFCNLALSVASSTHESSELATKKSSAKTKKKAWESPEGLLKWKLDMCSKRGDLDEALRLYDEAQSNSVQLNHHHYNKLLYLCSSSGHSAKLSGEDITATTCNLGLGRGFKIFQQMISENVKPNEATFTNAARLAAAMEDPEMAFNLVKQMKEFDVPPKLRSYGPALFGFCKQKMADRAYEVDEHMIGCSVIAEEPELSALLKVSAEEERAQKVYELLHRLRKTVRQVTESTLAIIEDWFSSDCAAKTGKKNWDVSKVKEGVVSGGGGWHGQGWLGTGAWKIVKTTISDKGVCQSCGQNLVCIDIDPKESENFAKSVSNLAFQRERKSSFIQFQEWLKRQGPFDAVVDGANVGLNERTFNFKQLNNVVCQLCQISPSKKLPLIILHRNRVIEGPARNPHNKALLECWKKSDALYATPFGSNDDWYWLYAAVSSKCLLVTNDEMRDHLFQLLGTSFFSRWKEKHQVRLSVSREDGIRLHMPPPYSFVIQESENGSWHVPTVNSEGPESSRAWLCASRANDR